MFKRGWETTSRPLYLEVGKSERFYEAEINTSNCNILGSNAAQSSRQASRISEQHSTAIFRVNTNSAILNIRNAAICISDYTSNKTIMLLFTGLIVRVTSVFLHQNMSFVRSITLLVNLSFGRHPDTISFVTFDLIFKFCFEFCFCGVQNKILHAYVWFITHCVHKYALRHRCYIAVHLQFNEMIIKISIKTLSIAIHL